MGDFEQIRPTKNTDFSWSDRSKRALRYTISKVAVVVGAVLLVTIAFFVAEPEEASDTRRRPQRSDRVSLSLPSSSSQFPQGIDTHAQTKKTIHSRSDFTSTTSSIATSEKLHSKSDSITPTLPSINLSKLDAACAGHCIEQQHTCFYDCEREHKVDTCVHRCQTASENCSKTCNGIACSERCLEQQRSCNDDCSPNWIGCRKECNQGKVDCLQICKPLPSNNLP